MRPSALFLTLCAFWKGAEAKKNELGDVNFVEAVVRLCELSPKHSLCSRVQFLDHPTEELIEEERKEKRRRKTKTTTISITTTTEGPTTTTKQFFRSLNSHEDNPLTVPQFADDRSPRQFLSRLFQSSSIGRFHREPPVSPPVQSTTASLWDWMNETAQQEGYLFEEDEGKREEIFKKRWIKAIRARKARRSRLHGVKTQHVNQDDHFPSFLPQSHSLFKRHQDPSPENDWTFSPLESDRSNLGRPKTGISPYYPKYITDPTRQGSLSWLGDVANVGFNFGIGVPNNDPVSVGANVGVGLGRSGLAGGLPSFINGIPPQGERVSMNDYDGDKTNIVPGRWAKLQQAIQEGRVSPPPIYLPANSLVGINSGVGVG